MANITTITPLSDFSLREQLAASKLNSQIIQKINLIYNNQTLINDDSIILLQGASGGSEQAKISLAMSSAPTGWTRDTSFTTDHFLRVTDGSTLPPGSSPTAVGGALGGNHTITGFSSSSNGAHTHTGNTHTHTMNHTHSFGSHTHTASHNHYAYHLHTMSSSGSLTTDTNTPAGYVDYGSLSKTLIAAHNHDAEHNHGNSSYDNLFLSTDSNNTDSTSISSDSGSSETTTGVSQQNITSENLSHNHTINADGTWRPRYLNIILCKKD